MITRNIDICGDVWETPLLLRPLYKLLRLGKYNAKFFVDIWNPKTNESDVRIYINLRRKFLEDITEIESDILATVQDACIIHDIPEVDLIAPKITYSIAHALSSAMVDENFFECGMFIEKYYSYTVTEDGLMFKRR